MTRALVFRDDASLELDEAYAWYDDQRPGLGDEFLAEVDGLLDIVSDTPERFPVLVGVVRQALVRRFPYAIYFRVVDDEHIRVLAVFHARRDPAIWRDRS